MGPRIWIIAIHLSLSFSSSAQSVHPQPRVATSMHTGAIEQIRSTPDGAVLATIGHDKTLRIWRALDLALIRTINVPSEVGREGQLYALALSPDGERAYVAGWTGITWHKQSQVYVFNTSSGRLLSVFKSFPGVITALAASLDGKRLAVGLAGGLRVIDVTEGKTLFQDFDYNGQINFVDFSVDELLATTSADGCIRVYTADGTLGLRAGYPQGASPGSACSGAELGGIRFSPNGRRIAFGLQDRPEVVLMDVKPGGQYQPVRIIKRENSEQRSLCCISWSANGEVLSVYGEQLSIVASKAQTVPIYRIGRAGLGEVRRLDVVARSLTNSVGTSDGGLIVATEGPEIMHISDSGMVVAKASAASVDFTHLLDGLLVSGDGQSVSLPFRFLDEKLTFTIGERADTYLSKSPVEMSSQHSKAERSGVVRVVGKLGRFSYKEPLTVNGAVAPLRPFESLYSWAGHASLPIAVLGTVWAVNLVDSAGMLRWTQAIPAPAYSVNLSADGRWAIAALGDGTVRWYQVSTGQERLALFIRADGVEWVAWRPDGYYLASVNGDELLGWLINRGESELPDFYRAVQFERVLYRPDLVRDSLSDQTGADVSAIRLGEALRSLAAPRVAIQSVDLGPISGTVKVKFSVESVGRPTTEVGMYIDGLPVLPIAQRYVARSESELLQRTIVARVTSPSARVRVEAENGTSLGIAESTSRTLVALETPEKQGSLPKRRLWVVAIGIQKFDRVEALRPLPYATNDATELNRAFAAQAGKAFSDVIAVSISESSAEKPTKSNILAGLRRLDQMRPEDTLVVFIASHGATDAAEYYVITKDADPADVRKLADAQARRTRLPVGSATSLLSGSELTAALRRLPGRRILILDTCQAGAAGSADPYSLVKRSASAQLAVVSAARGDESSYDSPTRPHGAFTIAIIDALTGRLKTPDGPITLRSAFDAATPQVQDVVKQIRSRARDVAERATIRQTPVLSAPAVLQNSVLANR